MFGKKFDSCSDPFLHQENMTSVTTMGHLSAAMHEIRTNIESKEDEQVSGTDTGERGYISVSRDLIINECKLFAQNMYNNFISTDAGYPAWENFQFTGTNIEHDTVRVVLDHLLYLADSMIYHTTCIPVKEASLATHTDALLVDFVFHKIPTSEVEVRLQTTVLWGEVSYAVHVSGNTSSLGTIEADELVGKLAIMRFKILYHNTMIYPMMQEISPDHPEFGNEHHWSGTDIKTLIEVGKMAQILYQGVEDSNAN